MENKRPATGTVPADHTNSEKKLEVGAAQLPEYLPVIKSGQGALMVNHTSMIGSTHLVDSLLSLNVKIKNIFAPEHGFRGMADAGEQIKDGIDKKSGLTVISLYGRKKKPAGSDLAGVDWIIFDIQDVGARFYTYISSMHYLMQACAENDIPLIILDRPNPNGHYVDGPVMTRGYESFVGMHKVPVVHGMTIGEYAQMINREAWLGNNLRCRLTVVSCKNYTHQTPYILPHKPSPNLPNNRSIYLYPSLCFFEGTDMSVGRGTDKQFQVIGHPEYPPNGFQFIPVSRPGAKYPRYQNKICYGMDLSQLKAAQIRQRARIDLSYLLEVYQAFPRKNAFFLENNFFDKLAGGPELRKQVISGWSEEAIRESWKKDLEAFKLIRKKYLLYD